MVRRVATSRPSSPVGQPQPAHPRRLRLRGGSARPGPACLRSDHFGGGGGAPAGGRAARPDHARMQQFCTYCVVPNTRGPEVHRPRPHRRRVPPARRRGCVKSGHPPRPDRESLRLPHGGAISVDGREAPQVGPGLSAFRDGGRRIAAGSASTFAACSSCITTRFRRSNGRLVTSYPRLGDDAYRSSPGPSHLPVSACTRRMGSIRILKLMRPRLRGPAESTRFHPDRALLVPADAGIQRRLYRRLPGRGPTTTSAATVGPAGACPLQEQFHLQVLPCPGTTAIRAVPRTTCPAR